STQSGWASKAMRESLRKADRYLQDPKQLQGLSLQVQHKMDRSKIPLMTGSDSMRETWSNVGIMGRLVKAYGRGRYRRVPWGAIGAIVAALIYFVTPTDFIPDFVVGMGLIDDATIIALVAKSVATVLEEFRSWEKLQPVEAAPVTDLSTPAAANVDADGFAEIPIALDAA
ncbi:MAG: YkvA family protein, partial [Caldilineaceae bacterium]